MTVDADDLFFHFDAVVGKVKPVQLGDLVQFKDGPRGKEGRIKVEVQLLERPANPPKDTITDELKEQYKI